jgi:hypothetical protein
MSAASFATSAALSTEMLTSAVCSVGAYMDSSDLQAFFFTLSAGQEAQLRPYIRPVMGRFSPWP